MDFLDSLEWEHTYLKPTGEEKFILFLTGVTFKLIVSKGIIKCYWDWEMFWPFLLRAIFANFGHFPPLGFYLGINPLGVNVEDRYSIPSQWIIKQWNGWVYKQRDG